MPVSANQETAVKSLGGKSSVNIAGVPVKKRRFIWPTSPTPEEPEQSLVENNDSLEKEHRSPSLESETAAAAAASSSYLSDSNKNNFVSEEENKRSSDNNMSSVSIIDSRFRVEEPSPSQESDSLTAKLNDDEKLFSAEKSVNILTGVKTLGGVPMKKRRFIRPSSPPLEDQSSLHVEKDTLKEDHDSPSKKSALSDASVAGSSSHFSDAKKIFSPEDSDNTVQTNAVCHSKVKIEEACHTIQPDTKVEKLLAAEKSVKILVKREETDMNFATSRSPTIRASKDIFNQQIDGNCKDLSTVSGNPELLLGLKERRLTALGGQSNDGSSWNQGSVEAVSLKLSLSNNERSTRCKMDDMQSNTDSSTMYADRSNWDLNTTMDTWEASASEEASGQVTSDDSKEVDVSVTHDIKPLLSTGLVGASVATEKLVPKESESRTSFAKSSSPSVQQYNSEDRLNLCLSPSFLSFNSQGPSSSSSNEDSRVAIPNISLPKGMLSGGNIANSKSVKSEPFDESHRPDSTGAKSNLKVSLDFRAVSVKHELIEKVVQETSKLLSFGTGKSVDTKYMKSELLYEGNPEKFKTIDGTSNQSNKQVLLGQDSRVQSTCSANEHVMQDQATALLPSSTDEQLLQGHNIIKKPTSSIGSSVNDNASDHLRHGGDEGAKLSNEVIKEACESTQQVATEMGSLPVCQSLDANNGSGTVDAAISEKKSVDNSDQCKLKVKDEFPPDAHQNAEGTVSDDEKINLSGDMLEEDSYGSEYESDGNSVPMDIEDDGRGQDDYEDGEVREPQLNPEAAGSLGERRGDISQGDSDDKKTNSSELHIDVHPSSSNVEGKDTSTEKPVETIKTTVKDIDSDLDRKTIVDADKEVSREESIPVGGTSSGTEKKKLIKTIRRIPLDLATNKDKGLGTEQSSGQTTSGGQGTLVDAAQGADENDTKTNQEQKNESELAKVEKSVNGDDAPKDANNGGNQSRIINLSMASNTSSFGKTRSISGKPLSLRPGRERLDVPLEGDRLHHRGRDETYSDGSHKFSRERFQDSRNSRWNFVHGRGRLASRIDSLRNDRDSERDCIPRHKYASAVAGSDTEFMNYNMGSDGAFVGTVRGGRKLVDDDTSIFRHLSSRRRSPGGRDGPASRGLQMVRRVPRSLVEDNSEVVGLRHTEKIMRGFPDDGEEHAYTRPRPPYEGLDGRFVQGTRNFSSVQRRGLPQMRSKSPIRSRSPVPWSSRRRSPDGFGGPPDLPHRRSPIYRMERIRSPDNPGFPAERVAGRHGSSPSYLSRPNDLRDMDPGRDHGHPRSIISNRSPNGRGGLLRSSRRFGIVDPRERPENEEFFAGPVHSGRFHELGVDGNEERRRFGERRATIRSFRPPFNGADGENFNFSTDDGPRPFRFNPEVDPDFHERPNLREREFDRRIKNRPGNAPRRPRSIEEQEGNYRHGAQVLYDDSFDDISRVKRKRF